MTNQLDPFYATEETKNVLLDLANERRHQIEKGWTPEHDDRHSTHSLVRLGEQRLHIEGRSAKAGYYDRQRLVEGIAILVAAVEAWDRREASR